MIDDFELRALFKAEGEEHLQSLENGLLRLEANPGDEAMLEELFRSAHNLKGAARMLGVGGVETLAHHFEDELGAARRGHLAMSPATLDRLYQGLDAMRRLVREAGGGEAAHVDVPRVLAQLRGEALPGTPTQQAGDPANLRVIENSLIPGTAELDRAAPEPSAPAPPEPEIADYKPLDEVDRPRPAGSESLAGIDESRIPASSPAFTIDTIRVEPQKLDALMTLAGEMAVTTTRVARTLGTFDELVMLREEWGHDAATLLSLPMTALDSPSNGVQKNSLKSLAGFHKRELVRLERMGQLLSQLGQTSDEELTRLGLVADELEEAIRGMRLLPFSTVFNLFPRLVRDMSREQDKEVRLVVEGGAITADKHLLEEMKDPLMHLIRNAIDHGIERPEERLRQGKSRMATLHLRARQTATHVIVEVEDDGRGLDEEAIRHAAMRKRPRDGREIAALSSAQVRMLIFAPGFSTSTLVTDVSGRGVGLDVVRANIERLKGTVSVEAVAGGGCAFRLQAPITLATTRVLLVRMAQRSYALPVGCVQETSLVSPEEVFSTEGRPTMRRDGQPIPVEHLADLLELAPAQAVNLAGNERRERNSSVLLSVDQERLGIFVDALIDEQEVILKPFGGLLQRVRNISAATVLSTGEICMVLNPRDLIASAKKRGSIMAQTEPAEAADRRKVILLAEDSITTRTQEKRILEGAGYEVVTAVDGADAFNKLGTRSFDAVVSDIEMPKMNGLTLAARIRQDTVYKELPIILVTSLASDADRQRGIEVGANAYITKGTFEQKVLLDTLRRLV